ncbi:MAG: response regulator [Stenotrophobium sp.]
MTAKTALVVDDSKSARFALRRFLESHGYEVNTAESAEEAYLQIEELRPGVIFLDHIMPGIDGFQALEHLRNDPQCHGIPIIICSSHEGEAFALKAQQAGAAGLLQKPPSAEHLAQILERLATAKPAAAIPAPPSKISNIREPEVAIHQRVMNALRNTLAPVVHPHKHDHDNVHASADPAHATASHAAQSAGETALRLVQQDLNTQLAELRSQLAIVESRLQQQARQQAYQDLTREVTAVQQRMAVLEDRVEARFSELQATLEAGLRSHSEQLARTSEQVRDAAISEAHEQAERTVMSAATRISDQLAASIANALRAPALKFLSPSKSAESSPQEKTGLRKV